jgi:(p)ppGpp synthase/HD superfamily hydrolase
MEPWEVVAIERAAQIAAKMHDGQYLDDNITPYILHPARVAGLVAIFGGRYQEIVAAWLHAAIDKSDQGETRLAYGLSSLNLPGNDAIEVYRTVKALSKDPRVEHEEQLKDSLERVLDAPPGATLVKLCDRMDSISGIRNKKDREQYLEETMMVLAMLFGRSVESGYTGCHETLNRLIMEADQKGPAPG